MATIGGGAMAGWALAGVVATGAVAQRPAAPAPPVVASPCDVPPGFAAPFTRVYHLRDGRALVFVAVEHGRDPDDASHRAIAAAFARFDPALVYVEGIDTETPAAIAFQRESAERWARTGAIPETLYTVKLASDRGTPFASWDYRPDQAMRRAVDAGFALADVLGAHLMRAGADPAEAAATTARRRELGYAARIGAVDGFDYLAWYRRHYAGPFDAAVASPCGTGIAARVLRAESDARSLHLAELIAHPVSPAQMVLVEAGANHWLAVQAYLRRLSVAVE